MEGKNFGLTKVEGVSLNDACIDVLAAFALEKICPSVPGHDESNDFTLDRLYQATQALGIPVNEVFECVAGALDGYLAVPLAPEIREFLAERKTNVPVTSH